MTVLCVKARGPRRPALRAQFRGAVSHLEHVCESEGYSLHLTADWSS